MTRSRSGRHALAAAVAAGVTATALVSVPASAGVVTRTSGTGENLSVSWTEYDPDDLLGLPGNVHVGNLWVENGPYGSYLNGHVTDFQCDDGESPWGGHHLVTDAATDIAADAAEEAIEDIIDSGQATIDAAIVADAIQSEVAAEAEEVIEDHFDGIAACDHVQDRYLDGTDTTTFKVDAKRKAATITGTLTVSNGGHGEPGDVLGAPPINLTITGGDWEKFDNSYSIKTASYAYSNWQAGTGYNGGTVTGHIGAMDFADDLDDEAWGYFSSYKFRTVDRIR